MVELSTSDRCKKKLQLTFQIQSAITQRARPYRTNSHFSLSLFISLIAHISPGLFERDLFWLCTSELWMVSSAGARGEACLRADVMPACREVARLDESRRRTRSAKLGTRTCLHMRVGMCSFFPTDGSAPATGGRRQEWEKGDSLRSFPFLLSSLWLSLFIYPLPQPGAQTLFLCLSRWWFDTVCASSLVPCWPRVPLLLNVQG